MLGIAPGLVPSSGYQGDRRSVSPGPSDRCRPPSVRRCCGMSGGARARWRLPGTAGFAVHSQPTPIGVACQGGRYTFLGGRYTFSVLPSQGDDGRRGTTDDGGRRRPHGSPEAGGRRTTVDDDDPTTTTARALAEGPGAVASLRPRSFGQRPKGFTVGPGASSEYCLSPPSARSELEKGLGGYTVYLPLARGFHARKGVCVAGGNGSVVNCGVLLAWSKGWGSCSAVWGDVSRGTVVDETCADVVGCGWGFWVTGRHVGRRRRSPGRWLALLVGAWGPFFFFWGVGGGHSVECCVVGVGFGGGGGFALVGLVLTDGRDCVCRGVLHVGGGGSWGMRVGMFGGQTGWWTWERTRGRVGVVVRRFVGVVLGTGSRFR